MNKIPRARIIVIEIDADGETADTARLATELAVVVSAMMDQRRENPGAGLEQEIARLSEAQIAASKGDAAGFLSHLKGVGGWTLKIAEQVGAETITRLLGQILGNHSGGSLFT
jgi:hypothetical protein